MRAPVTKHTLPYNGPTVATFGGGTGAFEAALLYIKAAGRDAHALVRPPSGPGQPGFKMIAARATHFELEADGLVIPRRSAVMIYSRDCPIVTLHEYMNDQTVVYHAGRPALTNHQARDASVTDVALRTIAKHQHERATTVAYIAASICSDCFVHDGPGAEAHLTYFRQRFPNTITDPGGRLDLPSVIAQELHEQGLFPRNISHDGVCTREHPRLTSHRNGDKESNITVVLTN